MKSDFFNYLELISLCVKVNDFELATNITKNMKFFTCSQLNLIRDLIPNSNSEWISWYNTIPFYHVILSEKIDLSQITKDEIFILRIRQKLAKTFVAKENYNEVKEYVEKFLSDHENINIGIIRHECYKID